MPAIRYFGILVIILLTAGAAAVSIYLPAGLWITQLLIILPVFLFLKSSNISAFPMLGFSTGMSFPLTALVILAAASNYLVAAGGLAIMDQIIPASWPRMDASRIFQEESGFGILLVTGAVIIAAPVCEEVGFRGFMQKSLAARSGPWPGIFATALLFSALHMDAVGFLSRFELGILFGWLLWRTGSLWAPILAHLTGNGIATGIFFISERFSNNDAETIENIIPGASGLMLAGALVLVPTLIGIYRLTAETSKKSTIIKPVDPSLPVGFTPRASLFTSLFLFICTFLLALSLISGYALKSTEIKSISYAEIRTANSLSGDGSTEGLTN